MRVLCQRMPCTCNVRYLKLERLMCCRFWKVASSHAVFGNGARKSTPKVGSLRILSGIHICTMDGKCRHFFTSRAPTTSLLRSWIRVNHVNQPHSTGITWSTDANLTENGNDGNGNPQVVDGVAVKRLDFKCQLRLLHDSIQVAKNEDSDSLYAVQWQTLYTIFW